MWHFYFTVAILEVYLHKVPSWKWTVSSFPVSLCGYGVFPVSQSSTKCRGMKRIQIKNCDSVFLLYWFMACGQLAEASIPEALLVFPSRSSGNSTLGRSHTWKQCIDHIGRGSSGYARKIELFPLTLVSYSTVLELIGNELGP